MKINWGTGITIAIVLFMGYILLMVYKAVSTEQHLQAEDYYAQEIDYQTKIDALRLGDEFIKSISFIQTSEGAELNLPEGFNTDNDMVDIYLLRENDSALDLKFSVAVKNPKTTEEKFIKGLYKVTVSWVTDAQDYATESEITFK